MTRMGRCRRQGDATIVANVLIWAGGSSFTSLSTLRTAWNGPAGVGGLERDIDRVVRGRSGLFLDGFQAGSLPERLVIENGDAERTRTTLLADWPGLSVPKLMIDGLTETALWTLATTEIGMVCGGESLVIRMISSLK